MPKVKPELEKLITKVLKEMTSVVQQAEQQIKHLTDLKELSQRLDQFKKDLSLNSKKWGRESGLFLKESRGKLRELAGQLAELAKVEREKHRARRRSRRT